MISVGILAYLGRWQQTQGGWHLACYILDCEAYWAVLIGHTACQQRSLLSLPVLSPFWLSVLPPTTALLIIPATTLTTS